MLWHLCGFAVMNRTYAPLILCVNISLLFPPTCPRHRQPRRGRTGQAPTSSPHHDEQRRDYQDCWWEPRKGHHTYPRCEPPLKKTAQHPSQRRQDARRCSATDVPDLTPTLFLAELSDQMGEKNDGARARRCASPATTADGARDDRSSGGALLPRLVPRLGKPRPGTETTPGMSKTNMHDDPQRHGGRQESTRPITPTTGGGVGTAGRVLTQYERPTRHGGQGGEARPPSRRGRGHAVLETVTDASGSQRVKLDYRPATPTLRDPGCEGN